MYCVEADHFAEALDKFIEYADAHKLSGIIIDPDSSEGLDYGWEANPGDIIGGLKITEKCWINLKGVVVPGPLVEPRTARRHLLRL